MRALDNGKLTQQDRAVLNQQQNQVSNEIYQDKHNAAAQNYKGEVGRASAISRSASGRASKVVS